MFSKVPYYIPIFESRENFYCPDGWDLVRNGVRNGVRTGVRYGLGPIPTIKVFVTFKKADYNCKIQTSIFASQPHIKMERLSSGPSRALLSQFPSGDKGFQEFKKGGLSRQN